MTLHDYLSETHERYQEETLRNATKLSAQEFWIGGLRKAGRRLEFGTSVWDKDWDVLVIMDACRPDLFEESYGSADWLDTIDRTTSVGSASPEWMNRTFNSEYHDEMGQTAYICGNAFSENHADGDKFAVFDEVWKYAWDDCDGTIHPHPLTDRAIKTWQSRDELGVDQMIIHYMQPHYPYVAPDARDEFETEIKIDSFNESTETVFDQMTKGEVDISSFWSVYQKNLEYVVEHLRETLLTSIDADSVALSADHGNLLGEWGLYGHPHYVPIPSLKEVPWAMTSATDTGEYSPDTWIESDEGESNSVDDDVENRLESLGYV